MPKLLQINPVLRMNTSTGRIMQEIGDVAMSAGTATGMIMMDWVGNFKSGRYEVYGDSCLRPSSTTTSITSKNSVPLTPDKEHVF